MLAYSSAGRTGTTAFEGQPDSRGFRQRQDGQERQLVPIRKLTRFTIEKHFLDGARTG
jgi:hypothetical protein